MPVSAAWTVVTIRGVQVRHGKLTIGLHTDAPDGGWIRLDDVRLSGGRGQRRNVHRRTRPPKDWIDLGNGPDANGWVVGGDNEVKDTTFFSYANPHVDLPALAAFNTR